MKLSLAMLILLAVVPSAARADESHQHYDWAGLPSRQSFSLTAEVAYQRGDAVGGSTYSRFSPQVTFSGSMFGGEERTSSGNAFGLQFVGSVGWRTGESTLSGPTLPEAAIPVRLYMDLGYYALMRALGGEHQALVAFLGPQLNFGGPEWNGGMLRLGLTVGARFAVDVGGLDLIAELKTQPVQIQDDPVYDLTADGELPAVPIGFDRLDYLGTLYVRTGKEAPLFGLRLGVTPMRARGFFGKQWTFSFLGGF